MLPHEQFEIDAIVLAYQRGLKRSPTEAEVAKMRSDPMVRLMLKNMDFNRASALIGNRHLMRPIHFVIGGATVRLPYFVGDTGPEAVEPESTKPGLTKSRKLAYGIAAVVVIIFAGFLIYVKFIYKESADSKFLDAVHKISVPGASDSDLKNLGKAACGDLERGMTVNDTIQDIKPGALNDDNTAIYIVSAAQAFYCPHHSKAG